MLQFHTTPDSRHGDGDLDDSDGTTRTSEGSRVRQPSSHYTTIASANSNVGAGSTPAQVPPTPYFTNLIPDWDTRKVIPKPVDSFVTRLQKTVKDRDEGHMKPVHGMWKTFKRVSFPRP